MKLTQQQRLDDLAAAVENLRRQMDQLNTLIAALLRDLAALREGLSRD